MCEFKIYNNCIDCNINLTIFNRALKDSYASFCQDCWDKREEESKDIEEKIFMCKECGSILMQDPENLFNIYCPQCLELRVVLKRD